MQRKKNKYKLFDDKLINILKHKQRKMQNGYEGMCFFFHQKYVIVYLSLIMQLPIER